MSRRLVAAGIAAAAVVATCASVTPTASGDEPPPMPASPIGLRSPDRMVAQSWGGRVWTDFGIRMVAGSAPFEIWSNRPSWKDPVTSVWRSPGGDVTLPDGSMTTFRGLDRFARITIAKRRSGEVVRRLGTPACFNGYGSVRMHPDAPATSPYPRGCPWNPYTLGSVMGIQSGWSTPMLEEWGRPVRLAPGRYVVTATIRDRWVDFFGILPGDATTTTRLRVVREADFRAARPTAPASEDAQPAAREPVRARAGAPVAETVPDLRSLPAFGVGLNGKGTQLRFAATVWNGGGGPLVVDGFRSEGGDHMDAYQYFFDADGNQTGYEHVGEFGWHGENHQHWHFEDFARYTLLNADRTDAVRSTKASFCLANTDAVDYTIPRADWQPENTDLSSDCGGADALSLRQVLSNGSGDTYLQYRAGQAFPIRKLPDGVYYIEVEANPLGTLVESDATNNSSVRRVRILTNRRGDRVVRVPRLGVIEEGRFF